MERLTRTGYQQRGCPVKPARKVGPATYCGPARLYLATVGPRMRQLYGDMTVVQMRAVRGGGDAA